MEVERTTTNDQISNKPLHLEEPLKESITNSETTPPGGFDCNICLDFAVDPVVTLCGHLYCWQCIYKWLSSMQNCPVCKASLSINSLVPLYGRGHSTTKRAHQTSDIPPRPHHLRPQADTGSEEEPANRNRHHHHYHLHHHYSDNSSTGSSEFVLAPSPPLLGATTRGLSGMAIAVLPWMFRNRQEFGHVQLGNSSPYHFSGISGGSPRMRRQEKEIERSLHQIWLFLSTFAILCLLLF